MLGLMPIEENKDRSAAACWKDKRLSRSLDAAPGLIVITLSQISEENKDRSAALWLSRQSENITGGKTEIYNQL